MFSGQGSQYFQMGQALYQEKPNFREWMRRMDAIVFDLSGYSVVDTLYNNSHGKNEIFDRTLLSHPAIFMVQYALAQTLIEADIKPDMTLGTSLGAFAAAAIAGYFSVEDALKAVVNQAKIFEAHCQKGGMIAILAAPQLYQENILKNNSEIASYNFSTHFVISAKHDRLKEIEAFLREKHLTFQRLPVSFAFHSQWIEEAKAPYQNYLQSLPHKSATIPMVCCASSTTLNSLTPDYFWTIAREPIRFQQTIAQLEIDGTYEYIDVGPAGTLATFLKYALPSTSTSTVLQTLTPFWFDLKKFTAIKSSVV